MYNRMGKVPKPDEIIVVEPKLVILQLVGSEK